MFRHGSIVFTIKNKETGKVESLRRNHNWFCGGDYEKARKKEARKFKKEWNQRDGYSKCLSVDVS